MAEYITYYRVSTSKQGVSGAGLGAQEADIKTYLESYAKGSKVISSYTDVISGTKDSRPQFDKAVEEARVTGATLLVAKLDRLSRKVSFIATLMEDKKLNFKVASMPYASKFELHIYAALAEQERDFISARTKAALAVKKAQGVKLGSHNPKVAEANQRSSRGAVESAEKYRGALSLYRKSKWSYGFMAKCLNDEGHRTVRGNSFTAMGVKRMSDRLGIC